MSVVVNILTMIVTGARATVHFMVGAFLLLLTAVFVVKAFEESFWVVAALWFGFHGLKWVLSALSVFSNSSGG